MSIFLKRSLTVIIALVAIILVAAVAIPYFYKDKVVALIKEETNKSVNAKVDFADVDLSILRSFPDLNIRIEKLRVEGVEEFEEVTLFSCPALEVDLDLMSIFKSEKSIPIQAIRAIKPNVNILVLQNGKANWDIVKPSEETTETADYLVELEGYTIEEGHLTYIDESLDFQMELYDLKHSGKGNFTANDFDLNTKTTVEEISASMEGMTYLDKAKGDLEAIIGINLPNMLFTLKDNQLKLNLLTLIADGTFKMNEADYEMDLRFNSADNNFKSLCSLIPAAYTADYKDAKIDGNMTFNGFVKGKYSETDLPAFQIKSSVENGGLKYPDLPIGISNIFTNILVNSPSSDFDKIVVDIPQFKLKVGDNPIEGQFNLRTPMSDPKVNTFFKGILDLAQLEKAFPMEGVKSMKGIINADIAINAAMSQIEKEQYDKVDVRGNLGITDLLVAQADLPAVTIKKMETTFSPQNVNLTNFDALLGKSDLKVTGKIDNLLAYFHPETTMEGNFKFASNYFDANEWMTTAPAATEKDATAKAIATTETTAPFDRFNLGIEGNIKKLEYDTYSLTDMVAKGKMNPNEFQLDRFATKIGESDIAAAGSIKNLYGYAMNNEVLMGKIDLSADYLNLNQFMTETTPASTENVATEVILVPDNIDMTVKANLKKVRYTNFDLSNIKGQVIVKDGKAMMDGVKGNMLGGEVAFEGGYDTSDPQKPMFDMKTSLAQISFKDAFNTFNTFQALAPIGKFLDGKFTSNLSLNGILGKDLMPDLSSLNMDGFVHTWEAVVNNFKPLELVGEKLNIEAIKNLKIKDSKNWLTIKNGTVELKEFDHKFGDIAMKIGGSHSLSQDMNYTIKAKIPRDKLNKNAVGVAANKGWNFLSGEASKLGVNLQNGEFVNVNINLFGSMLDPKFTIKPMGADGTSTASDAAKDAIKANVDKAVDSVKTRANEEIAKVKEKANEEVKAVKDSITNVAKAETEKLKEKGKDALKNKIDSTLIQKTPVLDSIGVNKAKEEAKKAKDKLKDLNPFGKKKKENG